MFNRLINTKLLTEICNLFTHNLNYGNQLNQKTRCIHNTFVCYKKDDRKGRSFIRKKDEGTEGETTVHVDTLIESRSDMFPVENTPNMLFNGIQFSKIPICNIKVTKNNTILGLHDAITGKPRATRSCGVEGFKNCRKGTNIAAQTTAITFATEIKKKGFSTIRVRVRGLGPGRMSAIKGLEMAGLNIVSITDNTRVSFHPPRPRKQRRL